VYQSAPLSYDLWALPFSLDTLKATGEAFPISENSRGPTVAADQTLVYLDSSGSGRRQLVWLDRRGEKTGEIGEAQEGIGSHALSPDGRLVAVTTTEGSNQDVWVHDIDRGTKARVSRAPEGDWRPSWSPAGEQVAFSSDRAGNWDILLRQADGSGEEQVLAATHHTELLSDWSRDGKYLLYHLDDPEIGPDLWYLERKEDGSGWEPHPFLQTPSRENVPRLSPDGRYVAYVSDESGQAEVYVQPFLEGGRKVTVSSNGGRERGSPRAVDPRRRELVRRVSRPPAELSSAMKEAAITVRGKSMRGRKWGTATNFRSSKLFKNRHFVERKLAGCTLFSRLRTSTTGCQSCHAKRLPSGFVHIASISRSR